MSLAALLLPELDAELASTRTLLGRVPEGRNDWQPHPKSMKLGRLAVHVAEVPGYIAPTFTKDRLDIAPPGAPPYVPPQLTTVAVLLELFEKNAASGRAALAATPDEAFGQPWTFLYGGKTFWTKPRLDVYRSFGLNHLVHHRAQLGVYLRLLDIPIPGMYGPSADERMG
jgi:uncharacterized damage-inducible protein DinB